MDGADRKSPEVKAARPSDDQIWTSSSATTAATALQASMSSSDTAGRAVNTSKGGSHKHSDGQHHLQEVLQHIPQAPNGFRNPQADTDARTGTSFTGNDTLARPSAIAPGMGSCPPSPSDKPLPNRPDSPSARGRRARRRSLSPSPRLTSNDRISSDRLSPPDALGLSSQPVRRIKSFGDLLSSSRDAPPQSTLSTLSVLGADVPARESVLKLSEPISPETLAHNAEIKDRPKQPKTLKKRASSYNFMRRPSTTNMKDSSKNEKDADRKVSSATVPPAVTRMNADGSIEIHGLDARKRKGSGFSFFPSFFKSRNTSSKDAKAPITPIITLDVPETDTSEKEAERQPAATSVTSILEETPTVLHEEPVAVDSEPKVSDEAPSIIVKALAPERPSVSTTRRFSIFPSFFRSSSTPSSDATDSSAGPRSRSSSVSRDLNGTAKVSDTLTPQLPDLDQNLADISFGSLFDFDKKKKGSRSRASTRSSIFSMSQPAGAVSGHATPRTAPDTPSRYGSTTAQDYLSARRASISSVTQVEELGRFPARTPLADSMVSTGSTRMHRSNSASSVPSARVVYQDASGSHRPVALRARSSSTVTSSSLGKQISPAITVTAHRPFFDEEGLRLRSDSPIDGLTQSNLSPSSSGFLTPAIRLSTDSDPSLSALSLGSESPLPSPVTPTSPFKSTSILQKTLRKRAYTASSLSSSTPPGSGGGAISPTLAVRPGRSNSSSRLSSFFNASAGPSGVLSSDVSTNASWLPPRESQSLNGRMRSGSSSYFGSPVIGGDAWSSTSSLPYGSPRTSTTVFVNPSDADQGTTSPALSQTSFPAPRSSGRLRSGSAGTRRRASVAVEDGDTPESYLEKVIQQAPRSELATILASSGDDFHLAALKACIAEFDFTQDPIDIALRKLLLGLSLPKETQQIDRVMEAFAARYMACNNGLFVSSDHPYILAFSMIMLHTDAFNKSNKNKMTKADYVKNTRIDGISSDLLEYIFDNIVYHPFVYADDDTGIGEQYGTQSEATSSSLSVGTPGPTNKSKIDIYALMARNELGRLRVDVGQAVPLKNPFSYTGTIAFFDCTAIRNAFAYAHVLAVPAPSGRIAGSSREPHGLEGISSNLHLKIAKLGVLDRKDDIVQGGKKASSRKWKSCSVVLTGSQLLLFKDPVIAQALEQSILEQAGTLALPQCEEQRVFLPRLTSFKPDGVLSLNDTVALYDFSYAKYTNVFRLVQSNGHQVLFRAQTEADLNSWISILNYAASFRSAGIRMRSSQRQEHQALLDRHSLLPIPQRPSTAPMPKASSASSIAARSDSDTGEFGQLDGYLSKVSVAQSPFEELSIFKKAAVSDLSGASIGDSASRSSVIRSKVIELESKIKAEQNALTEDLRVVRNLAILTPFTSASRQRIQHAMQPVARRIRSTRQNIAKLVGYRECLCRDLLATERENMRDRQTTRVQPDYESLVRASTKPSPLSQSLLASGRPSLPGLFEYDSPQSTVTTEASLSQAAGNSDTRGPGKMIRSMTSSVSEAASLDQILTGITGESEGLALHDTSTQASLPPPRIALSTGPSTRLADLAVLGTSPFETVREEREPEEEKGDSSDSGRDDFVDAAETKDQENS